MTLFQETGHTRDSERIAEAQRLVEEIYPFLDNLPQNEQIFLRRMKTNFDSFGDRTYVSAKQLFWLRDVYEKVL